MGSIYYQGLKYNSLSVGGAESFEDLSDVAISNPQSGQVPKYNATTEKWENGNVNEATWGNITGTLADQTDLQTALGGKQDTLTEGSGIDIDSSNNISLDISYLTASRVGFIPATEKGSNNGVATLDNTGRVPSTQLPSYVDDIVEGYYNSTDHKFYEESTYETEITGETGKIYVSLDTNKTYRWSSSGFVEISESLALGETQGTAYDGSKGKANADAISAIESKIPSNATSSNKMATAAEIGDLTDLDTTAQSDLVSAINETHDGLLDLLPSPSAQLDEDAVVSQFKLKNQTPLDESVASVFSISNWSNLKRIRVVCPASKMVGAHTGIGTWDDTENQADWWQNDAFKYLDPSYKASILDPNGYDVDFDIKFDPTSETVLLGGYRVDTETGKMCIKFANYLIAPSLVKVAVDITFTRTSVI